ncbi:MAG TPA: PQQ-dependent sugar dehydrogenase [Micropepsaceae bacterium]|jgi:glucose/arabinose dehydrogenase|nr:PQQ-dependent sugar dehydrogenase [Micropepsaceae bacterium]
MSKIYGVMGTLAVGVAVWAGAAIAQSENQNHETIGQHFQFMASNLPPPFATPADAERSKKAQDPDLGKLQLPPGFHANLFAQGLTDARWLQMTPNGDVLLAESEAGKITLLRDADGDGKAEVKETFADGFQRPHGMAFANGKFYVADALGIYSFPYKPGDTKVSGPRTQVTEKGAFGALGGHWTRNLAADSKGNIYVAIGSAENIADTDPPHRAAVSMVQGDKLVQYATGLRNPVGITFYPGTDDLYVVVNERDGEGDELVPDYLTHVQKGAFYGWPYAYLGQHEEPSLKGKRPDLVAKAVVPDVLFRSHSAPLGLLFYTGTQFPEKYRGGAFVAHHGSWNASNPRGYKLVYVPFTNKHPAGGYENFALGFWTTGQAPAGVMGRPVGLAQAKDGSLLVADDVGNAVWRISYTGK